MEWIGVVGIVAGLVFFVIAAMRGWNVLITSLVTAVIIALTNGMDVAAAMVGGESSYVTGLAGFVQKNLLIFMGGAIMGEFMDKSGAAKSIANAIMSKVGTKSPYLVLLGIAAVGAILTYAGISMFVAMFALIPLARPMFKECNIPWHLFCAAWTLGACSFTMAMIPGVPAIAWINAANGCGVSLTAAPVMGIVGSVIAIAVSCLYIKFALKRAQAKGEVYEVAEGESRIADDKPVPNVLVALLPLVLLIAIIIVGSQLGVANIVYIAMIVAVVASMILFGKHIDSQRDVLGNGAKAALGPALFTSAAVGVGTVAAASVGFTVIYEAIFSMPGGTYVSAATMAAVLGGVMGSGSGAVGIIAGNFLDPYLATGVDPAALAKIIATSATIGGALPNSGAMFGMLAAMGLNHKNSYKHIAAISIGAGLCALVVMIVMANIGIV
ncbi:citrate transporter [Gordonibacter sp. 28C]|uniref:GntP family permease n=1 Tax=Gordonibacter sp. 28C TaxID=2078569 RepID=UPI000DF76962|nr:GntP family permease [Gordonibacter sp. 28C]RDB60922.1 citrate transporter [Gordonibacter sp. 28C]